jgi:hypothetical protein
MSNDVSMSKLGFQNTPSWPGLSRPSTSFSQRRRQDVDARDKPGHDELEGFTALQSEGLS